MIDDETPPHDAALAVRLLDGSPDGLLLVGGDGRIVLANRSATSIFGYSSGELVGRSVDELVPDEHRWHHAAHRQHYAEVPASRPMGTDLLLFGQHRNGQLIPVEISLSPISLDGDAHTVATIRDIRLRTSSRASLPISIGWSTSAHGTSDFRRTSSSSGPSTACRISSLINS